MIMRSHGRALRALSIAIPIAISGCVKLARESPKLQLYALGGGPADTLTTTTTGQPSAARGAFSVGLRRIEIAPHLSASSVMMRRGANQLVVSEFHRWGGDLDQSINRAVGAYLAAAPRVRTANVAPWAALVRHDVLVQLRIARFEGVIADSAATAGRVHVIAGWEIIRPLDGSVLVRGSTDDRSGTFRVGDYTGLVAGLDAALSRVARDIGACLARFPNDSTPPGSCASLATGTRSGGR
jgi:uncharacterized lipoprotein YmbA